MRLRKKLILWMMVGGMVLCLIVPAWLIGQQLRQDSLDHALIQAVKRLDAASVTRLLDQGAHADARDTEEPPLTLPRLWKRLWLQLQHKTISFGVHPTALYILLEQETSADKSSAPVFDTIASVLIRHSADVSARFEDNDTPLHRAAIFGLHQTVRLLLAKGVNVNAK